MCDSPSAPEPQPPVESPPSVPGTAALWLKIKRFLGAETLIPVIGPNVVTFGPDDRPFYPWLIAQVAQRLHLDEVPETLHQLVCKHIRNDGEVQDVCIEINAILKTADLQPGPLLSSLASISQCRLFFTLGFDPLMEWALNAWRGGGLPVTKTWSFSLDAASLDLPASSIFPNVLGYLFGKAAPTPGFLLWDPDAIEFVWQLQRQLPSPGFEVLRRTLTQNNLLIIGASSPDWLVRFLVRAIRQKKLTEGGDMNLLLADCEPHTANDAVLFYESLGKSIKLFRGDARDFARHFCSVAFEVAPALQPVPRVAPATATRSEPFAPGSIFVSYCLKDAAAAYQIVARLRAAGCRVWIDDERLQCGDLWDSDLEETVRECGFFVSVISQTTETKPESYFHKERRWAAQRAESMAERQRFYFPVIIDGTPWPPRQEPRIFAELGPERAIDGKISDRMAQHLAALQLDLRHALPT
jgi:hypothetical protein